MSFKEILDEEFAGKFDLVYLKLEVTPTFCRMVS